jgi:PAS domain S-box-containing protein
MNTNKMRKIVPYFVLLVCLSLTAFVGWLSYNSTRASEQERYQYRTTQIVTAITTRMEDYVTVLRGGEALFALSEEVTRAEWLIYVEHLNLGDAFPGIQGVGFSKVIMPAELEQHIQQIKAEGFPDYTVRPEGEREVYTSIIYLEPFDARNQRAFGYDMFSEPVRRAAMQQARDTNAVSISGKVTLKQETEQEVQAGFLMYLPVYTIGMPTKNVEERQAALEGYVYSAFRIGNLMQGIFPEPFDDIDFEIYDGAEVSLSTLMYDNHDSFSTLDGKFKPLFSSRKTIDLYGHQWTLVFATLPSFESSAGQFQLWSILATGMVISLLAFLFINGLENTRENALVLARGMTSALRKSEEELRNSEVMWHGLVNANPESVFLTDTTGIILAANETIAERLGKNVQEMIGTNFFDLLPAKVAAERKKHFDELIASGKPARFEDNRSGKIIDNFIHPIFDNDSKLTRLAFFGIDITERQQAEKNLRESEQTLRSFIINSPDTMYVLDLENHTNKYLNTAEFCGYPKSVLESRASIMFALHPEDIPIVEENWKLMLRASDGEVTSCEYRLQRKDGVWEWIQQRMTIILHTVDGAPSQVLVTLNIITARKRAEEALAESEKKLRALFETMSEGIVYEDHDGKIISANPAAERLLGLSFDQMQGRTSVDPRWKAIHADGSPFPGETHSLNIAAKTGKPAADEVMGIYNPKSGNYVWLSVNSTPEFLPGEKKPFRAYAVFRDITERKQAEETIRSLARFPSENPSPVLRIARDGNLLYANEAAYLLLTDWKLEVGKPAPEALKGPTCEVIETRTTKTVEIPGGERIFSISIAPAQENEDAALYMRDVTERVRAEQEILKLNAELEQRVIERTAQLQITYNQLESELAERKRAEEALRESDERFRSLSGAAFEAINIHDGGVLLDANEQYYAMFGYEPEELLGKQVMTLTIAPEAIEGVKKELATGGMGHYESTGLKKDGTRFPMEIRVREMEYKGRKVRVAAIMNITERKRAEETLQQRAAQLEAANKELEAFSYSVSHDLRAPLRGIDGWSLALLEDYGSQLDGQAKTYLERVRSETQRMGQLIDDLLQLSRLTSAEMGIKKVNLSVMAGTIADQLQKSQPERQVEFIIQPGLYANGDPRLLEIALTNLLGNAFKFTGKIPQALIQFGQTEVEGKRAFFVHDNGAGFDMALAKKLFGAFQRLHKASDFPGSGVGLSTVQRIVHRHGGRVWAEAAVNQGATFYFTLEEMT